jgi:hypothetical protein
MRMDLMRDRSKVFPVISNPEGVRSLRIWFCKYSSLEAIACLNNLIELVIAGFPDESLEVIGLLSKLRYLKIVHLPKVTNIRALEGLKNLETLSLATSPSWDSSGKITVIESLSPIALMPALRHLELFGVCPPDKSLKVLDRCKKLQSARFSKYPEQEVTQFYKTTGVTNQFNPKPSFEMT